MSAEATFWAWKQMIAPGSKLVLLCLADHSDREGICWPGQKSVAEKCGMNRSTVNKHISYLKELGLIEEEKRSDDKGHRTSSRYLLKTTKVADSNVGNPNVGNSNFGKSNVGKKETQDKQEDSNENPNVAKSNVGNSQVGKTASLSCVLQHESTNESTKEDKKIPPTPHDGKKRSKKADEPISVVLPSWLPDSAWNDYVNHRNRTAKTRLTQKAAEIAIDNLTELKASGHDPVKVIKQSILNNWLGLFPVKNATAYNGNGGGNGKGNGFGNSALLGGGI